MSTWDRYLQWNEAIAEEFFGGRYAGVPVYLDLEPDILRRVARKLPDPPGDARAAFVSVVRATLDLNRARTSVFHSHRKQLQAWRIVSAGNPPPCIGLLGFFALVAEQMVRDERYSAANYYGRLADVLGAEDESKVARDFQRDSALFWNTLNSWLSDADGQRGIPTAYAFDRRRFVGIPISQALIRDHDRNRLRSFFLHYGLEPGERLSEREMTQLLADWFPSASCNVSAALKALWRGREPRQRIASIACMELEAWDGQIAETADSGPRTAPLAILADLRRHPTPRLYLDLATRQTSDAWMGRYSLDDDSELGETVFAACADSITLERIPGSSLLVVEPRDEISIPDALYMNVSISRKGGRRLSLARGPRRVIPLRFRPEEHAYLEAAKVELLERHLVLCLKGIAPQVERLLEVSARQGYARLDSSSLTSLPADWVLFRDVEFVEIAEPEVDDLNPLVPLRSTQLTAGSGLLLARSTWHRADLPEIRAAAFESAEATLVLRQLEGFGENVANERNAEFQGSYIAPLQNETLPDGDYRIELKTEGESASSAMQFRVRSADHPRPIPSDTAIQHSTTSGPWMLLSAEAGESEPDPAGSIVKGAIVLGPDLGPAANGPLPPVEPEAAGSPEGEPEPRVFRTQARSNAPRCIIEGVHYWKVDEFTSSSKRNIPWRQKCRYCHLEKWLKPKKKSFSDESSTSEEKPREREHRVHALVERGDVDHDLLLDALGYLQGDSWESFRRVALQLDDHPWFPATIARTLAALGHIDLVLNNSTLRPEAWKVAPAALVHMQDGCAFLAGFRSAGLKKRLAEAVESRGGMLEITSLSEAPSVTAIKGLSLDDLRDLAEDVADSRESPLVVSESAPEKLLACLPSLSTLEATLPELSGRSVPLEFFDVRKAIWHHVDEPTQPGAYRFRTRPVSYGFLPPDGVVDRRFRCADVRTVKYLAARYSNVSLVGYDLDRQVLTVPVGAELPGLYDRVASLCSGRPAEPGPVGVVEYGSIPRAIAAGLWQKLAS